MAMTRSALLRGFDGVGEEHVSGWLPLKGDAAAEEG